MTKSEVKKSDTEEKIVKRALEMFNEKGVEYVGMRELAASLDMRIGNVTYYFPTKDELVDRLSQDLAKLNNETIVAVEKMSMKDFVGMLKEVFHNHTTYRCLMLSFVHLMERNPFISKRYKKVQKKRNNTWASNIDALQKGQYINTRNEKEVDFLVSSIALIARFWISEAAISFRDAPETEQISHYINLVARIFLPYATEKGKKELAPFLI